VDSISSKNNSGDVPDLSQLLGKADEAAELLKTLSHSGRLMILCNLADGEKSVGELEELLGTRQAAVSQQLARLRKDKLVTHRRDGKTIYYSLADTRAQQVIQLLYSLYCS
jgi:ArsR family transcriptional regulator